MFSKLLKMTSVLNKPGFWICHGCISKGYTVYRMCLIMTPYVSIMPEYASICLNIPQYAFPWLNIAECHWICLKMSEKNCSDYTRVFIIPWYSYNNIIIIVTYVIIIRILVCSSKSRRSATILSFFNRS